MLCTFLAGACVAVAASASQPPLQFDEMVFTQGPLGPVRASADFYRQDEVCLRGILTGLRTGADGQFDVTIEHKVIDPNGALFGQHTSPAKGALHLGGGAFVGRFSLPLDHPYLPPGEWTVEVTATDNVAGQSTTVSRKFRYRPLELAVVRPAFFADDQSKVPARPTAAAAGQPLFFRGKVVGFVKDEGSHGNAELDIEIHFLDADGQDVARPFELHLRQKVEEPVNPLECCDFNYTFTPNRPGKFTIRVVAHDKVGKKTATLEVPLHVQQEP
jgi:hypothetical protein